MDAQRIALVRASFPQIAAMGPRAARLFYGRLFDLDPSLEKLFPPARRRSQATRLMAALGFVAAHLDRPDRLLPVARAQVRRLLGEGFRREHYIPVGGALLWMLELGLGADFTPAHRAAWAEAYLTLAEAITGPVTESASLELAA